MKASLIIALFFLAGVIAGVSGFIPENIPVKTLMEYSLYLLMILVGMAFGSDPKIREILKSFKLYHLLIPFITIIGTFLGVIVFWLLFPVHALADVLAIGAGFGWYSLSGILINQYSGEIAGTTALLANVSREILTLLFTPLLVKYFGHYAPINSGGATSMDTTLPVIVRYSGKEYLVVALVHGILLTLLVPFIIPLIYRIF